MLILPEEDDLRILSSQFDGSPDLMILLFQRQGIRHNLLSKWKTCPFR